MTVLLVCKKNKNTLLFMYCGVLFYEFEIMHGHSLCVPPFWGEGGSLDHRYNMLLRVEPCVCRIDHELCQTELIFR